MIGDFLSFMAVIFGSLFGGGTVLIWLSSRLDRGRWIFAAAEKALAQCASNWRYDEGDYFRPSTYEGLGFRIVGSNPFSVSVRYGGAPVQAGFGWSLRLSWMALGMANEKDRSDRYEAAIKAMEKMMKENKL